MQSSFRIITKIYKNQHGMVFPYVLFILIVVSAITLLKVQDTVYLKEQIEVTETLNVISNLKMTALYDLKRAFEDSEHNSEQDTVTYHYQTGTVTLVYSLESPELLNIHMTIHVEKNKYEYLTFLEV
ncbi:hypothetical protein [Halalkalibacillus halophilus]|uniref:hypothetical protein n=1 Tax=Halalkalibacillus halophilus TaxID=392827 RepID=UPI000487EC03|nr:hypothetical protein [Halalkalibacillus halophilus]